MSHYLLYVSPEQRREELPWPVDLLSWGIVLLHARNVREAVHYCRAYKLIMVLLELPAAGQPAEEAVAAIAAAAGADHPFPILGVAQAPFSDEERRRLALAGMVDMILRGDPEQFIRWRLETLTALSELRRFEQAHASVADLASRTRSQLHDLSQPLSAVQGRLQLLAARCPSSDPNSQTFQDLVRLIFDVTHQVMEIQQIHRQFS